MPSPSASKGKSRKSPTSASSKRSKTPAKKEQDPEPEHVEHEVDEEPEESAATKRDNKFQWTLITTWVTLVSTIGFNLQFFFIYQNMQQGPLFNTVITEYSAPEILDALDMVEDFARHRNKHHDDLQYAYDFVVLKDAGDPLGHQIDHARRRLTQWYQKVEMFFEFNLLSTNYMQVVPGRARTEFFMWLIEPLDSFNRQIDQRPMNSLFDALRSRYGLPNRNTTLDFSQLPESVRARKLPPDAVKRNKEEL